MSKYNIELAHIYVDEHKMDNEQVQSINKLKELLNNRGISGDDIVTCVWIDDYNPKKKTLDVDKFIFDVNKLFKIDYACSEGLVAKEYDSFRNYLGRKDQEYYDNYLSTKKKLPCSLLTAMWYFMRLNNDLNYKTVVIEDFSSKGFEGDKIINILPKKFANSEKKVMKIFKENDLLSSYIDKIETIFY